MKFYELQNLKLYATLRTRMLPRAQAQRETKRRKTLQLTIRRVSAQRKIEKGNETYAERAHPTDRCECRFERGEGLKTERIASQAAPTRAYIPLPQNREKFRCAGRF